MWSFETTLDELEFEGGRLLFDWAGHGRFWIAASGVVSSLKGKGLPVFSVDEVRELAHHDGGAIDPNHFADILSMKARFPFIRISNESGLNPKSKGKCSHE